jgi:hypothetical protein
MNNHSTRAEPMLTLSNSTKQPDFVILNLFLAHLHFRQVSTGRFGEIASARFSFREAQQKRV